MAFEQVTREMLLFEDNNVNGRVQGLLPTGIKPIWEAIFKASGPQAEFYNDLSKWDMLRFPNYGPSQKPVQITIKVAAITVDNIAKLYNDKRKIQNRKDFVSRKNVTILFKSPNSKWVQPIKFQASGIKPRASSGKKISDATFTAMQELGSAWVLYRAFTKGTRGFNSGEEVRKDKETYEVLQDIWNKLGDTNGPDDEWLDNFVAQSKAVLGDPIAGKGQYTEFSRGYRHSSVHGPGYAYKLPGMKGGWTFMEYITNFVRTNYGISSKDNWNPADIWMIRDEAKYRKIINQKCKTTGPNDPTAAGKLQFLNEIMRSLYKKSIIVGVSLKKVSGKTAKYEAINVDETFLKSREINNPNTVGYQFEKASCPLGTKPNKDGGMTLETQDSRLFIVDKAGTQTVKSRYNFQIKGNSSQSMGGLKYEATQEGYGAARLGKATIEYVIDLLRDHGIPFNKESSSYPQTLEKWVDGNSADIKKSRYYQEYHKYLTELSRLGSDKFSMKTIGAMRQEPTVENALNNLTMLFVDEPHVANSKLQQIKWLHNVLVVLKNKGDEKFNRFCTELVFLSKKEGRSYGPFGKVY